MELIRIDIKLINVLISFCFSFMGYDHCAWLVDDGSVRTFGSNKKGQLGLGNKKPTESPSLVPNLPPISSVSSGSRLTICLDTSGNLWSFGLNSHGQLGLGDTTDRSIPIPQMIPGIPPVLSFSTNCRHTACLCEDGSIWVFGCNGSGQLGLGHQIDQSTPVQLPSSCFPDQIASVKTGYAHCLFLTSEGQVFSCGNNEKGQLGLGDTTDLFTPALIPNIDNAIQIACGGFLSCIVDSSYHLWVCGSHKGIQQTPLCCLSVGLIQNISVGYNHTLCINQSGELWGWGNSSSGQLGNGSIEFCKDPKRLKENIESCLCLGNSSFIRNSSGEDLWSGKNAKLQHSLGHLHSFSKFPQEEFRMCFPVGIRKFSQKSARSALPLPE